MSKITSSEKNISIESLIKQITNLFDDITEIHINHHPSISEVTHLIITIHTSEAESYEQYIDPANIDEVTIDTDEAEPLSIPFDIISTFDSPGHPQGGTGTTVYMAENVWGAESRELETGLSVLQQKMDGVCPICKEAVEFQDHYTGISPCRKAERV